MSRETELPDCQTRPWDRGVDVCSAMNMFWKSGASCPSTRKSWRWPSATTIVPVGSITETGEVLGDYSHCLRLITLEKFGLLDEANQRYPREGLTHDRNAGGYAVPCTRNALEEERLLVE
jgi:hypothetical protein